MNIIFHELAGSPIEEYLPSAFRAQRRFLVPWEDREKFAQTVLGQVREFGAIPAASYPGKPGVVARRVRIRPLEPATLRPQMLRDPTAGLNDYSGSFAEVSVEYEWLAEDFRPDMPVQSPGSPLSYRIDCFEEVMELASEGWRWDGPSGPQLSAGGVLRKTVAVSEHWITLRKVLRPPWSLISELQGKVNAGEFLGYLPETLLFVGARVSRLFPGTLDQGPSEFVWEIRYKFLERAVKCQGQVYGWNHVYRGDAGSWSKPWSGGGFLYDLADFTPLLSLEQA